MEAFYITRHEMAELLRTCKTNGNTLELLKAYWLRRYNSLAQEDRKITWDTYRSTSLPPIFERIIHPKIQDKGLSLNEIVALGNQIEYTHISITSVQNWVKRDIKDHIGTPRIGRKYSIDQAALLFIVEDLKTTLDFQSIRKLFSYVFNNPNDDQDDLMAPTDLYHAYATIFEELDRDDNQILDIAANHQDHNLKLAVTQRAQVAIERLALTTEQRQTLRNLISIAVFSVQAAYFHTMARRLYNAILYRHDS